MLELTPEEITVLENTVIEKLCASLPDEDSFAKMYKVISQAAVRATIATVREYERMQAEKPADPQPAE